MTAHFCPNCQCETCQQNFVDSETKEIRRKQFELWNWDRSPAEVAEELSELWGEPAWDNEETVFWEISQFFDSETADVVRDIFETCYC